MGINEIRDARESLLTERLRNARRVERREGESSGSGREFQQLFEFARRTGETPNQKETETEPIKESPQPPLRVLTPEEIESMRKRDEIVPGQLIDIEI